MTAEIVDDSYFQQPHQDEWAEALIEEVQEAAGHPLLAPQFFEENFVMIILISNY